MTDPKNVFEFLTWDMRPDQRRVLLRFCWRAGIALHIAIACGWLAGVGVGGFAWANDVKKVQGDVSTIRLDILEERAFNLRLKQCDALKEGLPTAVYAQRLADLLTRYQELTGRVYALPTCAEL